MGWFRRTRPAPRAELSPTPRFVAAARVVAATQGDCTVLLDQRRGTYYTINEAGTLLWDSLREGATAAELADRLERAYDADRATLERDVARLLDSLSRAGLLVTHPSS